MKDLLESKEKQIKVWDLFVRIFHWSMVALMIISYLSGELEFEIHSYAGYAIFGLVLMRVIWGFIGSHYARFNSFVFSPSTVLSYMKSIISGSPKRFLGHNPAGGLMVVALLITLCATTLSGMKLYAIEEGEGPFANDNQISLVTQAYADSDSTSDKHKNSIDEEAEEFWENIHESSINLLLFLILLHVLGVALTSAQHKENLVRAMITGKKQGKWNKEDD